MTTIAKQQIVPYSPSQMFHLVDAIEEYPNFVPWCTKTQILSRDSEEVRAKIEFAKGGVSHAFSTINHLKPYESIEMRLLEGPFKHLEGIWRFDPAGEGCLVRLDMEFILANRFLDIAIGSVLKTITNQFVSAFAERAVQVYGTSTQNNKADKVRDDLD